MGPKDTRVFSGHPLLVDEKEAVTGKNDQITEKLIGVVTSVLL